MDIKNPAPMVVSLPRGESLHPYALYLDGYTELTEAPEYVIDDVLTAGTAVIAGERGLGKTSVLVPMMLCAAGLTTDYPLTASIRRKVVYVAEDTSQVRRIISAMRKKGMITATKDEFNSWFKLVEAKRMKAHDIVQVIPEYDDLYAPNKRIDGTIYMAPPVVVLDTTNATIDLDNISDNAEVSNAVALLRQRFGAICLVLVGHVSKASRRDVKQLSFVGAGSWEGDTQQSLYLVNDSDERYLVMGKKRFEPDVTEYRIASYVTKFEAINKLGCIVEIKCFYGVPEASSSEARADAQQASISVQKSAVWHALLKSTKEYIARNPGAPTRDIQHSVSGNDRSVKDAIDELISKGEVRAEEGPRKAKKHYVIKLDTVGHSRLGEK